MTYYIVQTAELLGIIVAFGVALGIAAFCIAVGLGVAIWITDNLL